MLSVKSKKSGGPGVDKQLKFNEVMYSTEQSFRSCWLLNSLIISLTCMGLKFQYSVHKILSSCMDQVPTPLRIHCSVIHPSVSLSPKWSISFMFCNQILHAYLIFPLLSTLLAHPILWTVKHYCMIRIM